MSEDKAQEQQEEAKVEDTEAVESAQEPEPTPAPEEAPAPAEEAPTAEEKPEPTEPAKRGRRGSGGCLPPLVALVFFVGAVVFYGQKVDREVRLDMAISSGRVVALSVLDTATADLVNAKNSIASHDFGDGAQSLRSALVMINVAAATANDRDAVDVLERARKSTEDAIDSAMGTNDAADTSEQVDTIINQVKGCQVTLTSAYAKDTRKNVAFAQRYWWLKKKVMGSLEDTVAMFEASSKYTGGDPQDETLMDSLLRGTEQVVDTIGDGAEDALKGIDAIGEKVDEEVSGGSSKTVE